MTRAIRSGACRRSSPTQRWTLYVSRRYVSVAAPGKESWPFPRVPWTTCGTLSISNGTLQELHPGAGGGGIPDFGSRGSKLGRAVPGWRIGSPARRRTPAEHINGSPPRAHSENHDSACRGHGPSRRPPRQRAAAPRRDHGFGREEQHERSHRGGHLKKQHEELHDLRQFVNSADDTTHDLRRLSTQHGNALSSQSPTNVAISTGLRTNRYPGVMELGFWRAEGNQVEGSGKRAGSPAHGA